MRKELKNVRASARQTRRRRYSRQKELQRLSWGPAHSGNIKESGVARGESRVNSEAKGGEGPVGPGGSWPFFLK